MKTILVLEDESTVRSFIVKVLRDAEYRVLEADSAEEALAVAENLDELDLLLTDSAAKTMTGREVAHQLCRSRPRLKVLHMSGYPREYLVSQGALAEDMPFLPKPFVRSQLLCLVEHLLNDVKNRTAS